MNPRRNAFKHSSRYIREWLVAQPSVKEESLTDWLLFNLSKGDPSVVYRAFTRHQEARITGADWEWWFVFPKESYLFRVQAKKASPSSDNYPDLARSNQYGLQVDKLLNAAETANAIPLYALYSAAQHPTRCRAGSSTGDGVFMAGGNDVNKQFIRPERRYVSDADLLSCTVPLTCFSGCPLLHRGRHHMVTFLDEYFSEEMQSSEEAMSESMSSNTSRPGVHAQLPGYVSSLLELRGDMPDWWEGEFRFSLPDVDAILVHDFRDDLD